MTSRYTGYVGCLHNPPFGVSSIHFGQAWSRIVHSLIPNAPLLSQHLTTFASICNAVEVVLFERTTFLIIARSGTVSGDLDEVIPPEQADTVLAKLNPERFEKLSELIRAFRTSCRYVTAHLITSFIVVHAQRPDFLLI